MNLTDLAAPFPPTDIEWRLQSAGKRATGEIWAKCVAFITNRAIMERLDAVCGPENWKNDYREWTIGAAGVLCGISIKVGEEWITKWDGAEQTDIEAMKGGLSAAMKRAAVQWGIGRYLYDLSEGWAKITPTGEHYGKLKQDDGGDKFRWDAPDLPTWALPNSNGAHKPEPAVTSATPTQPTNAPPGRGTGPYAPSEKQVAFFQKLADSPVFTAEERKRALDWLATKATRQTIKDQIDWLKRQVETRKSPVGGGSDGDFPDEPPPGYE